MLSEGSRSSRSLYSSSGSDTNLSGAFPSLRGQFPHLYNERLELMLSSMSFF